VITGLESNAYAGGHGSMNQSVIAVGMQVMK
jgi:hypothetical protein